MSWRRLRREDNTFSWSKECEITGIGRLSGTVTAIAAPRAAALGVGHMPTDSEEVRRVAFGFDERVPAYLKDNYRAAANGKPGSTEAKS